MNENENVKYYSLWCTIKAVLKQNFYTTYIDQKSFLGGMVVQNLPANAGGTRDTGLIPGSGISPGLGNGNPFFPGKFYGQRSLANIILANIM